jgi:hypothetical protein
MSETCSLTLREMDKTLIQDLKKESRTLGMSPTRFLSILYVLYQLQCTYSQEQILQYWRQATPEEYESCHMS